MEDHFSTDLLRGHWFSLVPLAPGHYPALYELGFREQNSFRWRFRGSMPSFAVFEQGLLSGVMCQFAICRNDDSTKAMGLVTAYAASLQDDHCYVAAITDRRAGAGAVEGVMLFFRYLFRHWPLRKIYIEALEFNVEQYKSAISRGLFVEEGRLLKHHYFDGRYWDQIIYAMYREAADRFAAEEPLLLPEGSGDFLTS